MAGMTEKMFLQLAEDLTAIRKAVERIDKKLVGVKSAQKTTKADKAGKDQGK